MRELARFFVVALAGVVIDIGLSWTLAELAGVPLTLAAAIGFVVATVVNYIAHETWTFGKGRGLSGRRALKYLGVLAAAFATRLGVLVLLQASLPQPQPVLAMLVAAIAATCPVPTLGNNRCPRA